jgi:hypothetical protein
LYLFACSGGAVRSGFICIRVSLQTILYRLALPHTRRHLLWARHGFCSMKTLQKQEQLGHVEWAQEAFFMGKKTEEKTLKQSDVN